MLVLHADVEGADIPVANVSVKIAPLSVVICPEFIKVMVVAWLDGPLYSLLDRPPDLVPPPPPLPAEAAVMSINAARELFMSMVGFQQGSVTVVLTGAYPCGDPNSLRNCHNLIQDAAATGLLIAIPTAYAARGKEFAVSCHKIQSKLLWDDANGSRTIEGAETTEFELYSDPDTT